MKKAYIAIGIIMLIVIAVLVSLRAQENVAPGDITPSQVTIKDSEVPQQQPSLDIEDFTEEVDNSTQDIADVEDIALNSPVDSIEGDLEAITVDDEILPQGISYPQSTTPPVGTKIEDGAKSGALKSSKITTNDVKAVESLEQELELEIASFTTDLNDMGTVMNDTSINAVDSDLTPVGE